MSTQEDFTKHAIGWKWLAWACLVLPLSLYIIKSTADTWPNLLTMAWLGAVTTVGLSLYVAIHTTDADTPVRNKALAAAALVEIALIFNAIVHGGGSRAYENANVALSEKHTEENRTEQMRRQKAEDDRLAAKVEADRLLAEKAASDAAARRADAETRKYRVTGVIASAPRVVASPAPAATIGATETAEAPAEKRKPIRLLTPAEALAEWYWWVFSGLIGEMVLSALAAFLVLRERFADRNKNGVADWKERLDPETLWKVFPADYVTLYGRRDGAQPGFAPAMAKGNDPK